MKFVATDGTVFTDRQKYRKYEMETQYTFREKESMTLTKAPGSIKGQPFDIADCNNCEILILDHCDQVQIDAVSDSKVFVAASSESIFIRDCVNCTFTVACKQLRARDCRNCTFYLYCKTEPIIETSVGLQFAPFNGAYPGHSQAMQNANLNPESNLWFAVYDFNADGTFGGRKNWKMIEIEDPLWTPLGPAENCIPRVEAGSIPIPSQNPAALGENIKLPEQAKTFSTNMQAGTSRANIFLQNSFLVGMWVWSIFMGGAARFTTVITTNALKPIGHFFVSLTQPG